MSPVETTRSDELCVVCDKDTSGGRGFMTLHPEGRHLALCCPQCRKVYQETPAFYIRRQQTRDVISDVNRALNGHNP